MTMISYTLRNTKEKCWLNMILSGTIRFVEFKVPMESGFFSLTLQNFDPVS